MSLTYDELLSIAVDLNVLIEKYEAEMKMHDEGPHTKHLEKRIDEVNVKVERVIQAAVDLEKAEEKAKVAES